jgi:hypothetical protein
MTTKRGANLAPRFVSFYRSQPHADPLTAPGR